MKTQTTAPGPGITAPRKASNFSEEMRSMLGVNTLMHRRAGIDFDPTARVAIHRSDWDQDIILDPNAALLETGVITAVNTDLLTQGTYSAPLSTYATGWRENSQLKELCDLFAPEIPVGKRFEYKQWTNSEMLLSDDAQDDLRGVEGDVTTVQYTSSDVFARTQSRALRLVIDLDEVEYEPNWRETRVQLLTDRLDRNRLRRIITLAAASATATNVSWQAASNVLSLTGVALTSGSTSMTVASNSGVYAGLSIQGVGIPANTVVTGVSGSTTITLSAAASSTVSSSTAIVQLAQNPDGQVRTQLRIAGDSSGMRPNRVIYGRQAWDARTTCHETTNTAAGFAAAARSPESLATYLGVDTVFIDESRYQSSAAGKTEIIGGNVYMVTSEATPSRLDPSNFKCFVSPSQGGGYLRVFERVISDQMVEIIVSRRELLAVTTTLGLQQFAVSGS